MTAAAEVEINLGDIDDLASDIGQISDIEISRSRSSVQNVCVSLSAITFSTRGKCNCYIADVPWSLTFVSDDIL